MNLPGLISRLACFGLLFLLVVQGCKTGKSALGGNSANLSADDSAMIFDTLSGHKFQYDWFSGKARVKVMWDGMRYGMTANVRMQRDSLIWASISKFGFEVGRVLIRPDSAYVIDRFNKEYYSLSLDEYKEKYDVPFDFTEMQDLVAGSPLILQDSLPSLDLQEGFVVVVSSQDGMAGRYWMDQKHLRLYRSDIIDADRRRIETKYSDYQSADQIELAFTRQHLIDLGDEQTELELDFSTIEFNNPKTIIFNIPSHYDRIE